MDRIIPQVVLGIDPGYDRVGWAVGHKTTNSKIKIIRLGCIQTKADDKFFDRLNEILRELTQVITEFAPTRLAIESIFFAKNKKTAIKVAEARGAIIGTCLNRKMEIQEFTPLQIKSSVAGHGKANKQAVAKMVALQTGLDVKNIVDDAVDAVAVVITSLATLKLD